MKNNTKSNIRLRTKKVTNGDLSLYLDIYFNGARKYEFLKLYLKSKTRTQKEREQNAKILSLAESIRDKKELELKHNEYGFVPENRKKTNFITLYKKYLEEYNKRDKRVISATLNKFCEFIGKDQIPCFEINETLMIKFKDYLEKNLKGSTPKNYFKKFKMVLKYAMKERYINDNPVNGIKFKQDDSIKKEVLFFDEIQKLAETPCSNAHVKKAFIFGCYTGLRYCDLKTLKWKNITSNTIQMAHTLKKVQNKTEREVIINLNPSALSIIGKPCEPDELLFKLPSTNGYNKILKNWVNKAGITKKITSHCARHSFGTNIYLYSNDAKAAQSLLGHASMRETEKYVRLVESMKQKAVNLLPEININK